MLKIAAALPPGLLRFEQFAESGHSVFRHELNRAMQVLRDVVSAP